MTDRVDATMQAVKPPGLEAGFDGAVAKAQCHKLTASDDTVLRPGQLAYQAIGCSRLCLHDADNLERLGPSPPRERPFAPVESKRWPLRSA
jgi:hypothetical protein